MAHSDTTGERAPRAEELARIGTIKAELRRSAWWVAILAIVFPAAFVALAVALFIAYPSQLPVNFLTVLLGLVPVGISVLLILRGDSGRPLRLYRVLAKDAARGYLVAKRGGNIAWAARKGTFVAKSGNRELLSPWFTANRPVPTQWHHFERLAPGPYEFELLTESGLVLAAQSLLGTTANHSCDGSKGGSSPEKHTANVALQSALHLHPSDVLVNRNGRASGRQRRQLVRESFWLFLSLAFLAPLSLFATIRAITHPEVGVVLGALACSGITVVSIWIAKNIAIDALIGEIDTAAGYVGFAYCGDDEARGVVVQDPAAMVGINLRQSRRARRWPSSPLGAVTFNVSLGRMRVFQPSVYYRVYVFRRSRSLAGAEVERL